MCTIIKLNVVMLDFLKDKLGNLWLRLMNNLTRDDMFKIKQPNSVKATVATLFHNLFLHYNKLTSISS